MSSTITVAALQDAFSNDLEANCAKVTAAVARAMPDVQASHDARNIAIDKVGVKDIRYPISLHCPATGGIQHTVAR
ncbi:MAG: GTP cyclohydrolase, FolE2/MptA family, partial [Opitutales bacterium]